MSRAADRGRVGTVLPYGPFARVRVYVPNGQTLPTLPRGLE